MHIITGWRPSPCAGKHIFQNTPFCRGQVLSVSWFTSDNTTVSVSFSFSPGSVPTFLLVCYQAFLQGKDLRNFVWLLVGLLVSGKIVLFPVESHSIPQQEELPVHVVKPALTLSSSPLRGFFLWMVQEMLHICLSCSLFLFLFLRLFFPLPLPWRDFCGKRKWNRWGSKSACCELLDARRPGGASVSAEMQQPLGHLVRGLGQVTDQDPSWGRGQGLGFGCCLTFFCLTVSEH